MEQRNQNLMLSSLLSENHPTELDHNPKFIIYGGSRKESVSNAMPPYNSKSFHKLGMRNCPDVNIEKYHTDAQVYSEKSRNILKIDKNSKQPERSPKIRKELCKYRNELREFTSNTKELEERKMTCGDFDTLSDNSSTGSQYSLQRKSTQIFRRSNSFIKIVSNEPLKEINYQLPSKSKQNISIACNGQKRETVNRRIRRQSKNKENMDSLNASSSSDKSSEFVYLAHKSMIDDQSKPIQKPKNNTDVSYLKKTISTLQNDSQRFSSIIEQQKKTLSDYRSRFVKAQNMVKEQRVEIEHLNAKNQQLEKDTSDIIDELHNKVSTKLRDVNILSDRMRAEQGKRDYIFKENCMLNERMQLIEVEAKQLKIKLEEMSRRKMATISRLKVAERDLKIFKNYNAALKQEKRKLNDEMKSMSEQIDNMQNVSKRAMNRHRERNEKQRRQMQKRIFELEMKLNQSQNSTTSLIQERDTLISELQSQLNNLVHNFEVSQKHIRVLRRHIYSISDNNNRQSIIRNNSFG